MNARHSGKHEAGRVLFARDTYIKNIPKGTENPSQNLYTMFIVARTEQLVHSFWSLQVKKALLLKVFDTSYRFFRLLLLACTIYLFLRSFPSI